MSGAAELVERFLGPDAASGGLHALLGLHHAAHTIDDVIGGLERRLTILDEHPQGRTPEADEVRLALHAAAAQLIDHSARRSVGRATAQAFNRQLELDAIMTLARCGGWNRHSLRRLTMLAIARGAKPTDVARVLSHLARRRHGPRAPQAPRRRHGPAPARDVAAADAGAESFALLPPAPVIQPEIDNRPLMILIGAAATLLTLIVAVSLVVVAMTTGGPEPSPQAQSPSEQPDRPAPIELPMAGGEEVFPWQGDTPGPKDAGAEKATGPAFERLADALGALDSAAEGFALDPEQAVSVFEEAFRAVGARWCNLTIAQQRAAQHDVVEFVYSVVQRPELSERVIAAIAADAVVLGREGRAIAGKEIWPAAWSIGMLARLAREQDLGAVVSRSVESHLRAQIGSVVLGGGFEHGVQAALWAMLPWLVRPAEKGDDSAELWQAWIDAARFGQDDAQKTVLSALEWVLVAAAEPSDSEAVRGAIESLALGSDWEDGSAARPWLIRMFADKRVSNADLHAITTALSRRSRAPGVDATMALPVRSNAEGRDLMRERYAGAWGLDVGGPTLDDLAADWAKAAKEAAATATAATNSVERLAAAASLSRVSEAARLRFDGRLDEAGIVIDEFGRLVEMELTAWSQRQSAERIESSPAMSRWALSYLSAQRDFSERMRLLNAARQDSVREAVDAEVLVTEAVRGSPSQVRAAAREALLAQRPSAALTLAMLEIAPRMPRTAQNSELVSAVTATLTISVDDPDWRLKVRRTLVQTALEQLAAEGDQGIIDRLATLLGESYAARAVGEPSGSGSAAVPRMAPEEAAAMLRVQWERLARQGGLGSGAIDVESVLSRHASRLGLLRGPVQTFAAEQMAAFELMAIAVAAERIERAPEVETIEAHVREARRAAGDVVEQILVVERAFVDLWAIRLGQEAP